MTYLWAYLGNRYNTFMLFANAVGMKLYLVRETKGSNYLGDLRETEAAKIKCGKAHFDTLKVDYNVVSSALEV